MEANKIVKGFMVNILSTSTFTKVRAKYIILDFWGIIPLNFRKLHCL